MHYRAFSRPSSQKFLDPAHQSRTTAFWNSHKSLRETDRLQGWTGSFSTLRAGSPSHLPRIGPTEGEPILEGHVMPDHVHQKFPSRCNERIRLIGIEQERTDGPLPSNVPVIPVTSNFPKKFGASLVNIRRRPGRVTGSQRKLVSLCGHGG